MNEYSDYRMVEEKLRDGMYAGNMHACLRDIGATAGGMAASGRLSSDECDLLGEFAVSMAINKAEARRKWSEAVAYGRRKPLPKDETYAAPRDAGHAIGWEESVDPNDYRIVDTNWLQSETVSEPDSWSPCRELASYIRDLFEPSDTVMYCTDPWKKDGVKWIPNRGTCKTAEEMLKSLDKDTPDGFDEAVGTLNNEESGAWIRINPFDGKGGKDENVADFRHALVEFDSKPVDEQVAIYRKLELPCACIVHSGSKSAHAIVKIGASSLEEYKSRVNFLYEVLTNNGLDFDKQNRNPSRYSRMPGILRNGRKQYVISHACGKKDWDEWENWIRDLNDNLPDFEPLTAEEVSNPPPLTPELIAGILRVNHKMIVVGPSKAGKSFLLIELAIAIAEGIEWIGHKCRQGKVLYVNMELDRNSCTRRFSDVYKAIGVNPSHVDCIERWNLRGYSMPLDKLAPKLIRRASKSGFAAIILDPIYKVLTGDENNASDMSEFTRHYDKIARECGCSLIFCHHHSKGTQGDKRSMDRASGSGVFARDPDAMIDLLPLEAENAKKSFMQQFVVKAMTEKADEIAKGREWRTFAPQEIATVPNAILEQLEKCDAFSEESIEKVRDAGNKVEAEFESVTGWRASFTLREFASPKPVDMWFRWPVHVIDSEGNLKECAAEGSEAKASAGWKRGGKGGGSKKSETMADEVAALKTLVLSQPDVEWTISKMCEQFKHDKKTMRKHCKLAGFEIDKGKVIVKKAVEKKELPDEPQF